jgi:hypothetical protein
MNAHFHFPPTPDKALSIQTKFAKKYNKTKILYHNGSKTQKNEHKRMMPRRPSVNRVTGASRL